MNDHYPVSIETTFEVNLRKVGPHLLVGGRLALGWIRAHPGWMLDVVAMVDLFAYDGLDSGERARPKHGYNLKGLLRWPFPDRTTIPSGMLDTAAAFTQAWRPHGRVLIACQAGLSRSASVAGALLQVLDGVSAREAWRRVHVERGFPERATRESAQRWVDATLGSRMDRTG